MTGVRPLAGLRVLDFCWIGAGALVTKTLAELGASVYRVESHVHPDNLRLTPPFRRGAENIEGSGYFASRNPSKQSVAINMATEEGRAIAFRLASAVDIVTSNFRPGVMEKWGLSAAEVAAVNPSVIYVTMPMQGTDGPHASYIGFGSTISALSGLVNLSGEPGRIPVGTGTHYPDHVPNPGHTLVALLAAIRHRRRTGDGQSIELSQLESTVNVLGPAVLETSAGQSPVAVGNRVGDAAPHNAYRCADGLWCVVSCHTDDQWNGLIHAIGRSELLDDPRYRTVLGRKRHENEIDAIVAAAAAGQPRDHFLALLDTAAVPNAAVKSSRDIVEDPALWERGFWQDVEHPVIGHLPISRTPFRKIGTPRTDLIRPALLGEHTVDVLMRELGMTHDEIEDLAAREVLH